MVTIDDFRKNPGTFGGSVLTWLPKLRQAEASAAQAPKIDPNLTRAQQSLAGLRDLPGMQAAWQTGTYNGWNALADMLGAYWKVNGQGQAAQDAGFTGRMFGDGAHTAFNNAASEVMPNTDFLNQNQNYKRYF